MKTITKSIYLGFAALALVCFAVTPTAHAVVPAPDGGYPGQNTAEGDDALFSLATGTHNTANGYQALYGNTTGGRNTACGRNALANNTTGNSNTANGWDALVLNTTGGGNTASGAGALFSNTTAFYNVAFGDATLFSNTTGEGNTAFGTVALQVNTTGNYNTALGFGAGNNLDTGNNNIDIGNLGVTGESNTIRIGGDVGVGYGSQTAAFIAGIYHAMVPHGLAVEVDSTGHLGTKGSSERFKDAIKPMDKASEAILALKPVTFRYKKELDPDRIPQFGLVAEDVAKVNPDLVVRDPDGKVYTVRYDAVNAMLLNEFLKEHRKVEQLTKDFESKLAAQQKQIEALTAGLQKVSTQIEMSRPAAQVVENRQ